MMKIYVEAKSKADLIRRLATGEEISGYNYSIFGGGGHYMLDDTLEDGTIIAIYSQMSQGNPVAKSWGTWTNKVLKAESFSAEGERDFFKESGGECEWCKGVVRKEDGTATGDAWFCNACIGYTHPSKIRYLKGQPQEGWDAESFSAPSTHCECRIPVDTDGYPVCDECLFCQCGCDTICLRDFAYCVYCQTCDENCNESKHGGCECECAMCGKHFPMEEGEEPVGNSGNNLSWCNLCGETLCVGCYGDEDNQYCEYHTARERAREDGYDRYMDAESFSADMTSPAGKHAFQPARCPICFAHKPLYQDMKKVTHNKSGSWWDTMFCKNCISKKNYRAESFSAENKCFKCGCSGDTIKMYYAGVKGLICTICSDRGQHSAESSDSRWYFDVASTEHGWKEFGPYDSHKEAKKVIQEILEDRYEIIKYRIVEFKGPYKGTLAHERFRGKPIF